MVVTWYVSVTTNSILGCSTAFRIAHYVPTIIIYYIYFDFFYFYLSLNAVFMLTGNWSKQHCYRQREGATSGTYEYCEGYAEEC
jgi:hypothetical protein